MMPVYNCFAREDAYPDLDMQGAAERLGAAIRCRTVNAADHSLTDFREFDRLQELMRRSYPHIMRSGRFEQIGHAVLITLPGSDESLPPCLYMSHQDVVPVVEGTEGDWLHGPFSGDLDQGYIWGRGALDIKNMVFGILEAAEYLLARGQGFRRTAYLAFGDDEETLNQGALAIAQTLEERGVRLEFVLDEGGGKPEDGAAFGAPGLFLAPVGMAEKGYADLELCVQSAGGHSSRPFGGSSLEHLARAITAITDHPFPARLPEPMRACLEVLAEHISQEPLRNLVGDLQGNAQAIADCCARDPALFPYVTTTIAPTMIQGGSAACNVLPQNMQAVINFRLIPGDSTESLLAHCREVLAGQPVSLRFQQANDPSSVARGDSLGYRLLRQTLGEFFPPLLVVPSMTVGASDARQYERICDCCLRFSPFLADAEEVRTGVHGTNERISLRSYAQGIRVLIRLMELANVNA